MNERELTVDTYNRSATEFSEYFSSVGSRVSDVERGFALAGNPDGAVVVELGCGDGRDAREICKRATWYHGVDNSSEMIRIALGSNVAPDTSLREFLVSDMLEYEIPEGTDIVFAFASLLHLNRDEVALISDRVAKALRPGGIFYISLKFKPEYDEEIKVDQFGTRQFFYYSPDLFKELAGPYFDAVYEDFQTIGSTEWFTLALKKF